MPGKEAGHRVTGGLEFRGRKTGGHFLPWASCDGGLPASAARSFTPSSAPGTGQTKAETAQTVRECGPSPCPPTLANTHLALTEFLLSPVLRGNEFKHGAIENRTMNKTHFPVRTQNSELGWGSRLDLSLSTRSAWGNATCFPNPLLLSSASWLAVPLF